MTSCVIIKIDINKFYSGELMKGQLKALPNYQQLKFLFLLFNVVAISGWVVIIGFPFWGWGSSFVVTVVVGLLAIIYGYLLLLSFKQKPTPGGDRPGFFNMRGVVALFQNPVSILAAWVHILAFDLMAAIYIQQQGNQIGISHWLLIPCYLLTMMFGPLGLLLFLAIQWFVV